VTIGIQPVAKLPVSLANEFLFARLLEHHEALINLQTAGIVRTNFLECDDRSIYMFASTLASIPEALAAERFEIFPRYRNTEYVERCAYHLRAAGFVSEADLVETLVSDSSYASLSPDEILQLHKKAYLHRLLDLCHGYLLELEGRNLVTFSSGQGFKLSPDLPEGYRLAKIVADNRLSHVSPKVLFSTIASKLRDCKFHAAADRAENMYSQLHYL
jgi:hypothetical protein